MVPRRGAGCSAVAASLLAGFLLGAGITAAAAQDASTLTLDRALALAQENNPAYRRALNDMDLTSTEKLQAWSAFLPEFSVSAGTGVNLNRQLLAFDNFGNPIENPVTEWRTTSSSSQSIRGSIRLWEWGSRFQGLKSQRARARVREATVASRLSSLRANVIRTYQSAQSQQALLTVERDLLASRELDLETTRRMFDLAGASRVDVLTAELNVQQQEQRIQQARAQLESGLLALRTVIGDLELDAFDVSETLPEAFDPSGLDEAVILEQALASNPGLVQQEASVAISRADASVARSARWPGLALSFSASQGTYGEGTNAAFDPFPDRSRSGGASFGISVPLFPRFDTKARIVQAEVSLANAEETQKELRLQLEEQTRAQVIALQTAYQGYQISIRSQEIAQERLRLAREQFRLGSRTFTELQQDIDAAAQADRGVIAQLFELLRAKVNLEETLGAELGPGGPLAGEG